MDYKVDIQSWRRWWTAGRCLLCHGRAEVFGALCAACDAGLPRMTQGCPRCAAPVAGDGSIACGECQRFEPAYERVRTPFRYEPPVDGLVQQLKYHGRLEHSRLLGEYLAQHVRERDEPPDLLLPVPLHRSRLRERGYNQALEIARVVAARLRLPLEWKNVARVRATVPQTGLAREQRRKNMRGAFQVGGGFEGCSVAVIDDVMTSGYTVQALAEGLRRAGARRVQVWVVARA